MHKSINSGLLKCQIVKYIWHLGPNYPSNWIAKPGTGQNFLAYCYSAISHMRSHCSAMPSKKKFILIAHSHSTSLSLFLHYLVLLSLAPSSFSLSLAFLSDHQAIAVIEPRFSLRSTSRCPNHQASASADSPSPISKSVSLSPSFAFLSDHQAAVPKPRFSLRSPSRCPNHQASASVSADSPKLRRSLK